MKTQSIIIAAIGLAAMSMSFKLKYDEIKNTLKHQEKEKPTIVLVQGAFADGSSWNNVIPILQKKGYLSHILQS